MLLMLLGYYKGSQICVWGFFSAGVHRNRLGGPSGTVCAAVEK
jgi:hypothetical protein